MRIRAGFVTESAFDPLPGAKFSMRTIMSFERQLPTKRSRGRLNRLANVVDDAPHERRIVTLGHHPDQGFGARFADDETSAALELGLGGGDSLTNAVRFERGTAIEAHVLEQLRQRLELTQQLARRRAPFNQRREHLESG